MGRKSTQIRILDPQMALVYQELIRGFVKLAQDPLWAAMFSWWWLQTQSGLGWDDRQLLKAGIIDISRARAGVESSVVFDFARESADLAARLGQSILLAAPETRPAAIGGMILAERARAGEERARKAKEGG